MVAAARKDPPVKVEAPPASSDRAITTKVGLVAALGFVVGVAWPRFVGMQIGPNVPGARETAPSASAASSTSAPSANAPKPAASGDSAKPSAAEDEAPEDDGTLNRQRVVIADGVVESCRNKKGDKLDDCGKVPVDRLVKSRLANLSKCPSAIGLEGSLGLGISFDFDKSDILVLEAGKSALPSSTVKGVLKCAGEDLSGVELEKIGHTHARYLVRFDVAFYPPGKSPPKPEEAQAAAEGGEPAAEEAGLGTATITWEKALVRESPKDGKITTRIPQGARVKLLEQKDDWYRIESGKAKGWIYRQSIGR
jgi:hypothetical protein